MWFSPLEQFQIFSIIPLKWGHLDLSFSNSALFLLMTTGIVYLLFYMVTIKGGLFGPSRYQSLVEWLYGFVLNLVNEQIGRAGKKYFALIFSLFVFILFTNFIGMVPYSFTVTSHLIVTFSMSLSLFIGITIIGFRTHGLHFFSYLLPKGAPLALAPLLVVLELVSYCFRGVSLGVRLFANMMAGHTLLKVIAGFGWTLMMLGGFTFLTLHLIPILILIPLFVLESAVAVIQSFVFTVLICIYLNDAINLH